MLNFKKARACMRLWECWQLCAVSTPPNTLSLATAQIAGRGLFLDLRRTVLQLQPLKLYGLNIHHC